MLFIYLTLASVLVCLGVCAYSLYNNKMQRSAFFNLLNVSILIYQLGNFVEVSCLSEQGAMIGVEIGYLGLPFVPALWCLCILEFCGINMYRLKYVAAFMLLPALIAVLAFTWESNHLLFAEASYEANYLGRGQYGQLRFTPGPLYFIKPLYFYLFDLIGVLTIVLKYRDGTRRFRRQTLYFLASAMIPLLVTHSYRVETNANSFDITPYGVALASLLCVFAHHRYGLTNAAVAIKNRVVDGLHEGVVIFDHDWIHVDSNRAAKQLFPELAKVRLGEAITEMGFLPFDASVLGSRESSLIEYPKEMDGLPRTYNLSIARMKQSGKPVGYCVVAHNITALKSAMGDLEARACTDSLTGLFNRRHFFEKARLAVRTAKESDAPLCVIMFDLDYFKLVNDTYGHACGDYVLKSVASLIEGMVRKTDVLARYGGEEFCVLLAGTDTAAAVVRAEAMRRAINDKAIVFEGATIHVTASFGIAECRPGRDNADIDDMLKRADAKLYEAKEKGRNRVESGKYRPV